MLLKEEDDHLSGVELIDTTELDKILVDKNYYESKYRTTLKQNKRLATEVSRLARIVRGNNKKSK